MKRTFTFTFTFVTILTFTSLVSAIIGGSNSGLIYICLHGSSESNLAMYATTNQSNSCPQPPDNHHTVHAPVPRGINKKSRPHVIQAVQHDPDCIIRKVPAHH